MNLRVGTTIHFGKGGDYRNFLPAGFSSADDLDTMTWTSQTTAELRFLSPGVEGDIEFSCCVDPFIHHELAPYQDLQVFLNGFFVTARRIYNHTVVKLRAPRHFFVPRTNVLSFVLPRAVRPAQHGLGNDQRELGLAFSKIEVLKA